MENINNYFKGVGCGLKMFFCFVRFERPLPVEGDRGVGMHVGKKDVCPGAGDAMEFASEGLDVVEVAKNEGGEDEVGCCALDGQRGAASKVQRRFGSEFGGGALQHLGRGVHSCQTGRAVGGQKLKPSACAATNVEHIEPADVWKHSAEKALLQCEKRVWLLVVDLRPDVEEVG